MSSECIFIQAEDGMRRLVRSRGLGDMYKRPDNVKVHGSSLQPAIAAHLGTPLWPRATWLQERTLDGVPVTHTRGGYSYVHDQ